MTNNKPKIASEAQKYALRSPLKLLLIIAILAMLIETAVMFLLEQLSPLPPIIVNMTVGAILAVLILPILYLFMFRPLKRYIAALELAEVSLKDQRDHLEELVLIRTAEIEDIAFYDPLTRLPNRRLLMDRIKHALATSARSGKKGALLFMDLDKFKKINDTLGHETGDLLLKQVAKRLASCVREGDTVSRLGGDEFMVVLENLDERGIETIALTESICERMLTIINQPYQIGAHKHHSTVSIGATLFNGRQTTVAELMKQADIAMYQAKNIGRNTMQFFDPQMQTDIDAQGALTRDLAKALELQQFQLYYQVQMNELNHSIGAETLIRWIHPSLGLVSPAQFIPLAEETGLILPIGQWVLETACAQLKLWEQNTFTRDLILAVNVSARQFRQADFVAQVKATVQRHAINPKMLKLELTESMLVDNIEKVISTMNELNESGIHFSMDDFGTGYSSLQYLKRLPLSQLKIDMSFTRDLAADNNNSIVQTIIAIAKSMNMDVIAEGVETEEQRQLLSLYGCHHYQGYLFSKPVPIAQFETLLKQGCSPNSQGYLFSKPVTIEQIEVLLEQG